MWRKRKTDDYGIDYESLEEIISEILDSFDEKDIDLSKPLKVGFSLSLDEKGYIRIDEFGVLKGEEASEKKPEAPLVEVIDFEKEVLVVVETASLKDNDIDVRVNGNEMIFSNHNSKKFLKKVSFPCTVKEETLKTNYNNGVLELRLSKRGKEATSFN